MTNRYSVFSSAQGDFLVWDRQANDFVRRNNVALTYADEIEAASVAHSLNAPRYVCGCGYSVREDDREIHESSFCPLTAPDNEGEYEEISPNAGSAD